MKSVTTLVADITTLEVDAVVNSAKTTLAGGSGVDGAIHRAAGPELRRACLTLAPCLPGEAVMTDGFRLPAGKVIHTVALRWAGGGAGEAEVLERCCRSALDLAAAHRLARVAFPFIGTGAFGTPRPIAADALLSAVRAHAFSGDVIFCFSNEADKRLFDERLAACGV